MIRTPIHILRFLANAWLGLFYLNTLLAVADEVIKLGFDVGLLSALRAGASLLMVLTTLLVWLAVAATPRLPLHIFLPVAALITWQVLGSSPVSILLHGNPALSLVLALIQLAVAVFVLLSVHFGESRRCWWLSVDTLSRKPAWAWKRCIAFLLCYTVIGPAALAAYTWFSLSFGLSHITSGFIRLTGEGVQVTHRTYALEERQIDLIGMIHLGDDAAYREIFAPIPVAGSLLLAEGVSDEHGLLAGGSGYDRMARRVGIDVQGPMSELTGIEVRNADIDVSEFSESTITMLNEVFAMFRSDDLVAALLDYFQWTNSQQDPEKLMQSLLRDILDLRNRHLVGELDRALEDADRVVIPWGAYHLPYMEHAVLKRGFVKQAERQITLIPFGAIGDDRGEIGARSIE